MYKKISLKILSLLFFSIVLTLVINSTIQYKSIKSDYLNQFYIQSEEDIQVIKNNINEQKDFLVRLSKNIVDEKAFSQLFYNDINVINNQDALLNLVDMKLNIYPYLSYSLFDKYGNFLFSSNKENKKQKIKLPFPSSVVISTTNNAFFLSYTQPIIFENNVVAFLQLKKVFNKDNVNSLLKNSINPFSFVTNSFKLGNIDHPIVKEVLKHSVGFELDSHIANELYEDKNYFYHAHHLDLLNNEKLYYIMSIEKTFLNEKIKDLIKQLFISALIATAIVFLLGYFYLHLEIFKRINTLLEGIKKLKNKEFVQFDDFKKDEFDEIAAELNRLTKNLDNSFGEIGKLNEYLQTIINSIPVRVFWKDKDGKYLGANRLFLNDAKVESLDKIIGKTDFEMPWANTEAQNYRTDDLNVMNSNKPKLQFEETQTTPDGKKIYVLTSKVPLHDNNKNPMGILGIYEDITKFKHMQEELKNKDSILFEQSKMASMGELLENIAHQWRQPLNVITTVASGINVYKDNDLLTDEVLNDSIKSIINSAEHLSDTIHDFRNFYKQDTSIKKFNIKESIEKSLNILDCRFHKSNIIVDTNTIDKNLEIIGFQNELIQVIMNILSNSIDALEDSTEEKKLILISTTTTYDIITVSIKDNAGGIPEEVLPNIFEYKFTTKGDTNGTGIGLYMSKLIVEKSNASIEAKNSTFVYESNKYKGAEFIITFLKDDDTNQEEGQ